MNLIEGIRRLGFRRWYERQLIESHLFLVSGLLCLIAVMASLEDFSLQRPGWALADILLLWVMIVATIRLFAGVDRWAAWLLAPYLAWVSFATALNAAIYLLNR